MMTASLTDNIRTATANVARQARFVRLNDARIAPFTREILQSRKAQMTDLDQQTLGGGDTSEEKIAYALALDTINFGSGYFELAKQSGVALEYADLALHLRRAFNEQGWGDPARWASITVADCHAVFQIPPQAHVRLDELMALFARHLNEAGMRLQAEYGGKAMQLLHAAQGSVENLAARVGAWDGFRDVSSYGDTSVPIFKRAQIFAADVWLALRGSGLADFNDIDRLTIFADNMVPHVLRHAGVLTYDLDLAARIDAGYEIMAGSVEEVELRAVAIHAVECMRDAAHAMGRRDICAVNLDHILWNRGYEPDLIVLPRHRTLTVWY